MTMNMRKGVKEIFYSKKISLKIISSQITEILILIKISNYRISKEKKRLKGMKFLKQQIKVIMKFNKINNLTTKKIDQHQLLKIKFK